jgi:hypothetical protein
LKKWVNDPETLPTEEEQDITKTKKKLEELVAPAGLTRNLLIEGTLTE